MAANPVFGDFLVFLEHSHEVVGMLFANVFDAKVVDTGGEADGTQFLYPKPWCDLALLVAVLVQSFFEELLGNKSCMWQSIHSAPAFNVYVSVDGFLS